LRSPLESAKSQPRVRPADRDLNPSPKTRRQGLDDFECATIGAMEAHDSQRTEIIGRNYLVSQLVSDGLEVARPERDRGVDLIAYLDLDEAGGGFVACPIQMKAARDRSFGIAQKYEKFNRLLFAHVWHASTPDKTEAYGLTYQEAKAVGDVMGWTATNSFKGMTPTAQSGGQGGSYSTNAPSAKLPAQLAPFKMGLGDWKRKITEVATH
jgi:hypothetical protein